MKAATLGRWRRLMIEWTSAATVAACTAAAALAGLATPAAAGLVDRGGGLVYDTGRDITWLTAPALLPGPLDRTAAFLFAAGFEHAGAADWRLPRAAFVDPGCAGALGFGCTGSELGHLFHERLGGMPGESVFDPTGDDAVELAQVGLFPTLVADWYWDWYIVDDGGSNAFAFDMASGLQAARDITLLGHVLLVHDGDVGLTHAVPTPNGLPLVLTAVALALAARPRRRAGTAPSVTAGPVSS